VVVAAVGAALYLARPGAPGGPVTVELTGNLEQDVVNVGKALQDAGITEVKYTVWSGGDPNSVMRVYGVEPMGRESIVVAEVGEALVKALAGRGLRLLLDQPIWLCIDPEKLVLFDKTTRKALDYLM